MVAFMRNEIMSITALASEEDRSLVSFGKSMTQCCFKQFFKVIEI